MARMSDLLPPPQAARRVVSRGIAREGLDLAPLGRRATWFSGPPQEKLQPQRGDQIGKWVPKCTSYVRVSLNLRLLDGWDPFADIPPGSSPPGSRQLAPEVFEPIRRERRRAPGRCRGLHRGAGDLQGSLRAVAKGSNYLAAGRAG
jgi:hypothetical protein